MEAALDARGVTVRFGAFAAVDGVSLRVAPGEVFALLGPNGSGKTTLIRALCGLLPMAAGSATVLGEDVGRRPDRVRRSIAYVSQSFSLYEDLTAAENLDFYAGIYGMRRADARERRAALEELTGLAGYRDRRAGRLSGGWKQRLALACALLHRPRLLFLDEPTAGIDPVARREVWNLLFHLAGEGIAIFVTTHSMDEADRCSRVGYLHLSRLLAVGTPAELRARPEVSPPGTRRIEVTAADPSRVLRALRGNPAVREATVYGQTVRALVDADAGADALGLDPSDVRPAEPGLEDVFIALGARAAAAGGSA